MNCSTRSRISKILTMLVLACGVSLASNQSARAVDIDFSRYAAIAYSPSTGEYGYGWNHYSKGAAERTALSHCKYPDAKIVGWVQGGWVVLAIGADNSYGCDCAYGNGAQLSVAAEKARRECHRQGGRVKTYVHVCSGDYDPQVEQIPQLKIVTGSSNSTAKK